MKKFITLFSVLCILSCQKDDAIHYEQNQNLAIDQKVKINVGQDVSESAIHFIRLKTNNNFTIVNRKNSVLFSKNSFSSKSSSLGIIDTSKEVVVNNEHNTKHTFKVITPLEKNSITNLIVVERGNSYYEYFLKYNFIGELPLLPDTKAVDLSKFTGTIETFNSDGQQIGNMTIENGNMTENNGQLSPCPVDEEPQDDPNDTGSDNSNDSSSNNTTGGSDSSAGITGSNPSNNSSGNTSGSTSGGGGEIVDVGGDCGLRWSYESCGCGGDANGHPPSGASCCQGSPLIITDCNGNVLAKRISNNLQTMLKSNTSNPCEDGSVGVLLERNDCDTSKEDLKKIFSNISDSNATLLAKMINDKGADFGIDTKEKLWHFLAQAGHETGGFNTLNVTESTNYTTDSLLPRRYKNFTMDSVIANNNPNKYYAPDYTQNPSGVANIAMCCKYGNGNVASGDGYKYRGRGIFQLTWKGNYTSFKTWYNNKYDPDIDPVTTPSIIATNDTLAILSGMWYYKTRVLDKITVDSTTTVYDLTYKINKGRLGLKDRKKRFKKAKDSIDCVTTN